MKVKILLKNLKTDKIFEKEFACEFDRDKYLRRLPYFKNIVLVNSNINNWLN